MTSPDNAPVPAGALGQPVGAWGADLDFDEVLEALADGFPNMIRFFIAVALKALGDAVGGIPWVGDALEDVLDGLANMILETQETANTAQSTANTANTNASTALGQASAANSAASVAVSTAEAAANAAAAAQETADIAYGLSSYWEAECVVASAEVLLGVNELLIGLCQNVPDDRVRSITDLHIALVDQPGGMQVQTKKWNAAGTSNSVVHTATLGANVTRINYNNLDIDVADKERVYWNVTSITGSVAPNVLQCLVFGVILGE